MNALDGSSRTGERGARTILAVAYACAGLCGYSSVTVPALGTTLEGVLGISHTMLGVILSGYFAGSILASVILAAWVHGIRLKRLGMASLVLLAASNAVSLIPSVTALWTGRALLGMATTCTVMFSGAVIMQAFAARQARLISLFHGMLMAGGCVAMACTLPLARWLGTWQRVFLGSIGLAAVAAVIFAAIPCGLRADEQAFDRAALRRVVRHPAMAAATLLLFFYIVFEAGVIGFFGVYAEQELGIARLTASGLVVCFLAGILAGRLLAAVLPQGHARLGWVTAGLVLTGTACVAVALLTGNHSAIRVALFTGGLLAGPSAPLAIAYTVDRVGHSRNGIFALTNVILNVGGMAGPVFTGLIGERASLDFSLLLGTAAFFASALPLIAFECRARRDAASGTEEGKTP